jgi:type I restriction enzyme S subunit
MMSDLNPLFEPKISNVMSSMVQANAFRLDAGSYSTNETLNGLDCLALGDFAEISMPGRFARLLVKSPKYGIPFITSSEMMENKPNFDKYISKRHTKYLNSYFVEPGWLLISRSGTIGNIIYATKDLENVAVTEDAIRVTMNSHIPAGYVYSYLTSSLGKESILRNSYGAVVDHIEPCHLERIIVPLNTREIRNKIDQLVVEAWRNRVTANNELEEANSLIYEVNGILKFSDGSEEACDAENGIEYVNVSSKDVIRNNNSGSEYRLDAHFYNPMAKLVINNISQCKSEVKAIEDVTERVFLVPRFKRNYVEEEYGVPFLSGKNIVQIRPTDLKYLSKTESKNLESYYLEKNWTLITCSGTIGRTLFVWKNYEDYTATQHILRVVPDENKIDPGYLYAFLSSDYGYLQIIRYRHGSVIDEITDKQIKKVLIPMPSLNEQEYIGDLVRSAYDKRAEAIRLEDEAQVILMDALHK